MNNLVTITSGRAMTTSLDIAEGVSNPHSTVIRLIRENQVDIEDFGLVRFEIRPRSEGQHGGGDVEFAVLDEQQSTYLITLMRNNDVVKSFKKRLVKAFFEMREQLTQPAKPAELSRMDILTLAIDSEKRALRSEEESKRLTHEVEELTPKAEFHDKVVAMEDAISIGEAAKVIGTGRNRLLSFLRRIGWITRRNEPYQEKIKGGYMDVKLGQWDHPEKGLQRSVTSLVTGKGLARIEQLYRNEAI